MPVMLSDPLGAATWSLMLTQTSTTVFVGTILDALSKAKRVRGHPPRRTDGVEKVQTSLLKCQGRRWFEVNWPEAPKKTMRQVIDD